MNWIFKEISDMRTIIYKKIHARWRSEQCFIMPRSHGKKNLGVGWLDT